MSLSIAHISPMSTPVVHFSFMSLSIVHISAMSVSVLHITALFLSFVHILDIRRSSVSMSSLPIIHVSCVEMGLRGIFGAGAGEEQSVQSMGRTYVKVASLHNGLSPQVRAFFVFT
jgi:hypothetical protein